MHLLVPFLFHDLTSLHPPSFHRNDFSTCSTHFSFRGKFLCAGRCAPGARRVYRDEAPYTCMQMASYCSLETRPSPSSTRACSVSYNYAWEYFRRPTRNYNLRSVRARVEEGEGLVSRLSYCACVEAVEMYRWSKTTLETFGEKRSAEACSGKEIAGLLKKMMKNMMTRKS